MEIIKVKTADVTCTGDRWNHGCESVLCVTVADLKDMRICVDDYFMNVKCIVCPLCGTKTRVENNLTVTKR